MRTSQDGGRAPNGGARRLRGAATLLAAALLLATGAGCAARGGAVAAPAAGTGTRPVAATSGTAPAAPASSPSAVSGPGRPHHHHPSGPQSPHSSGSGQGGGAGGGGLDATAQRLAPYLQRHFGAAFAAVLVDDPHDQLVVYRLPDPRLDATARTMAGRTRLAFVTARFSFLRQNLVLARITHDLGYWREHGIVINSRGTTNGVHCAVIVTTGTGSAQQQRAFDARYGAGLVKVVQGGAIVYK